MSKFEHNWIDKVKHELQDYSPEYQATDWNKLKEQLPAPKPVGFWAKPLQWLKIGLISITTVAIISLILLWNTNDTDSIQTPPSTEEGGIVSNGELQQSVSSENIEIKKQPNLIEKSTNKPRLLKHSNDATNRSNTQKPKASSTKNEPAEMTELPVAKAHKTRLTSPETNQLKPAQKEVLTVAANENKKTKGKLPGSSKENVQVESVNLKSTQPSDSILTPETKQLTPENKQKSKVRKHKPQKKRGKSSAGTYKNKRKTGQKQIKGTVPTPFLFGLNGGIDYATTISPYKAGVAVNGGLTLEKFISKQSSFSVHAQIHLGTYNYNENRTKYDTTYTTEYITPGMDSLPIPVIVEHINESQEVIKHSQSVLYLDFPLYYNYFFKTKQNHQFGISAGFSNKYILNYKLNNEKQALEQKFYFAQKALFRINYKRKLGKQSYLQISPQVELPLSNTNASSLNGTNYSLSVSLLFQAARNK